ncbi:MAG: NAD(P)H-binding protein [Caldilineaceae bacterium]
MKILVLGATGDRTAACGATPQPRTRRGRHCALTRQVACVGEDQTRISVISANLLDLSDAEMTKIVAGCDAVASCLGHNLTIKGIFGPPHRLVTDATRRFCQAIQANNPTHPVKFVLMNTTGNRNRDLNEPASPAEKIVLGLLRRLLPPQADNEAAADYLRTQIGQDDPVIEWVAVRPDSLIDEDEVTEYTVHASPTTSPIFKPGKTSRINVGHFMADLITEDAVWSQWKGQMPVLYDQEPQRSA